MLAAVSCEYHMHAMTHVTVLPIVTLSIDSRVVLYKLAVHHCEKLHC